MIHKTGFSCFIVGLILAVSLTAQAAWEIGGRAGYDSNVNRTISGGVGDTILGGYLQYAREVGGEKRLDWTFAAFLEGNAFLKNDSLSNAGFTLSPGLIFFPYLSWSINISPFVQGKLLSDNDQSAVALGAKINLKQPLGKHVYLGEYYVYTDSRANEDVYSYAEHTLGVYLGANWTSAFFTEIGYEFARGDSFLTFESAGTASGTGPGRGKQYKYSSTFATEVYKDRVNRHSGGVTIGVELFHSVQSTLSYTYSTMTGDLGTSEDHLVFAGISFRF